CLCNYAAVTELWYAVGHAQASHVIPARVGVLRRRSRIIVERTKSIRGAIAVVNAIIEVPARDCGLDGRDIRELPRIQVKGRIGKDAADTTASSGLPTGTRANQSGSVAAIATNAPAGFKYASMTCIHGEAGTANRCHMRT